MGATAAANRLRSRGVGGHPRIHRRVGATHGYVAVALILSLVRDGGGGGGGGGGGSGGCLIATRRTRREVSSYTVQLRRDCAWPGWVDGRTDGRDGYVECDGDGYIRRARAATSVPPSTDGGEGDDAAVGGSRLHPASAIARYEALLCQARRTQRPGCLVRLDVTSRDPLCLPGHRSRRSSAGLSFVRCFPRLSWRRVVRVGVGGGLAEVHRRQLSRVYVGVYRMQCVSTYPSAGPKLDGSHSASISTPLFRVREPNPAEEPFPNEPQQRQIGGRLSRPSRRRLSPT